MSKTQKVKNITIIVADLSDRFSQEERKYLLELETNCRPGPSFHWSSDFEVIKGEITKIELEHIYDYPCYNTHTWLIMPKKLGTTLYFKERADPEMNIRNTDILYTFTKEGWKSLVIQ